MPASSFLTPRGRTRLPGVYSEVTAVGVPLASPGAKVLLLIGEAAGGEAGKLKSWTRPASIREEFRSGDLRTAALMAFDPARDSGIPSRPAFVFTYKTNPALQATVNLADGAGDVAKLTSRDWGDFANRIGVDIALGTAKGRKVTVTLDEKTESWDDVGGEPALGARYVGEAATMPLAKSDTGLKLTYTASIAANPVDANHTAGEAVEIFSDDAYDTHQKVTVYGTLAGDVPTSEVLTLSGAGVVGGAAAFDKVTAVRIDGATVGTIKVRSATTEGVIFTTAPTLLAGITSTLNVVSTSAADVAINVLVKGKTSEGNNISEVIALNGLTKGVGLLSFVKVTSAEVMASHAGTVSVRKDSDDTVGFSMAPGTDKAGIDVSDGLWQPTTMFFDGKISHALSAAAGGEYMIIRGTDRDGAAVTEYIAPAAAPAVLTTADFVAVTQIEIGGITAGRTLDISGTGADVTIAARPKLRDAVAFLNGLPGVTATNKRDAAYLVASLDTASQEIKAGAEVLFKAELADIVAHLNDFSKIVSAAVLAGADGAPDPTPSRVYLTGGAEGTTLMSHWKAAIAAAKALSLGDEAFKPSRMVTVALSDSAAVHALAPADLRDLDGVHERIWCVGLASNLNKQGVKDAIAALNHRGCAATPAQPVIYNDNGDEQTLKAWGGAVLMGASVCGSPVATPLTDKKLNALRFVYNADIDPVADAEEMIAAGAVIFQGRTLVRGVTTYRDDDNPFFTEMSTNESLDDSVFNLRRALRPKIGDKNFDGLSSTVRSLSVAELQRQVEDGEIKSFNVESVVVDDLGDAFDVSYEPEPIEPLNFVGLRAFAQRLSVRL